MMDLLDLDAIRRDHPLPQVAGAVVKLRPSGHELKACCPFHADKTPSFTIFDGGNRYQCFGCGASGDVLDFIQQLHNVGLREAADILTGGRAATVEAAPLPARDDGDRLAEAKAIWRSAERVPGTPAETYLRSRGLTLPIPATIRFARLRYGAKGREHPCLVAAVSGPDRKLIGIQRTYLAADGRGKADVPKPKLSLGRVACGAIRLAPAAAELVVCEGLEDGLTLQQELGRPVWVAAGASMLPAMRFPDAVRSVAIGGDKDDAGMRAAAKAADTFMQRGLSVRVFYPASPFKDFNQEIQERAAR